MINKLAQRRVYIVSVASHSSHESFYLEEGCVQYARDFYFSDDLYQIASPDDGYGDLTAVYGRDGKKLHGFVYHDQIGIPREMTDKDGSTLKAWQFLQYPLLLLN